MLFPDTPIQSAYAQHHFHQRSILRFNLILFKFLWNCRHLYKKLILSISLLYSVRFYYLIFPNWCKQLLIPEKANHIITIFGDINLKMIFYNLLWSEKLLFQVKAQCKAQKIPNKNAEDFIFIKRFLNYAFGSIDT